MAAAQSIWKIAFRNLSSQNTTTILTVAAIAVSVMTFVSIFSILDGLQLTIENVISGYYGRRTTFIIETLGAKSFLDSSIPKQVAAEYSSLSEIHAISQEDIVGASVRGIDVDLAGVNLADLENIYGFQSLKGRRVEKPDECMIGSTVSRLLGLKNGEEITVSFEGQLAQLRVVGVFETKTPIDANILVDRGYLSDLLPRFSTNVSILRIRVPNAGDFQRIAAFTEMHHPELEIREARQVSKFFQKSIVNISRLLSTIVIFVVLLMVLGIYNSMNMVVSERRWEIGIIRAMGARRSFVLRLFVLESAMLSVLGGLFGVALGIATSHAITSFFSILVQGSTTVTPLTKLSTIGWAMVASLSIGIVGGLIPSHRASAVQISEALAEG